MNKTLSGFIKTGKIKECENGGKTANTMLMLGIIFMALALGEALYKLGLGAQIIIMLYLLAVQVISAVTDAYIHGILAAILCTFAYDFQITEPRLGFSFTIGLPITLFIMLASTLATSALTANFKAKAVIASKKEQRTQQLYEINEKLLAARSLDTIAALTQEYLMSHLQRPAVLYTDVPAEPVFGNGGDAEAAENQILPLYSYEQRIRVHHMLLTGEPEPKSTLADCACGVFNVPIISKDNVLGVIGIACNGKPLSEGELTFVWMLASQVALALQLQYLSDEQAQIILNAEKEKMQSSLLHSISHDLRTPLTGILGTSATIMEQKDLDSATIETLAGDIHHHAQWLIRMVENILMIIRISGENLKIKKEPIAAEEVVSEAVSIVRKRFPGHVFRVCIPCKLLVAPMDGTLILQVLINLLENAAKNSPEGSSILVDLKEDDGYAKFNIIDDGFGIPGYLLDNLFEIHSTLKERAANVPRSTGLGLSICKTIIQAHGGAIEGHNRGGNGAEFSFLLPLSEAIKTDG